MFAQFLVKLLKIRCDNIFQFFLSRIVISPSNIFYLFSSIRISYIRGSSVLKFFVRMEEKTSDINFSECVPIFLFIYWSLSPREKLLLDIYF